MSDNSVQNNNIMPLNPKSKYKCPECDIVLISLIKLASHLKIHTKKFQCLICNIYFTTRKHLRIHTDFYHTKSNTGQYKCNECSKRFDYKDNITRHILQAHQATLLEQVKLDKNTTQNSQNEKASQKTKFNQCHLCTKAFLTKKYYYKNMEISHPLDKAEEPIIMEISHPHPLDKAE